MWSTEHRRRPLPPSLSWRARMLLAALLALAAAPAFANAPQDSWERDCAALVGPTFLADDGIAKVTDAEVLAAADTLGAQELKAYATRGKAQGVPFAPGTAVPRHCRVQGYVTPNIRFELRLPVQAWNERMLMVACDGFCGFVFTQACVPGLARDYATVTSDGGHTAMRDFDGAWGYRNPQAQVDFGHRANHVVAVAAKAIIAAFYGRPARHAYLTGCSKGGSAGVMAAARYPQDFDGIIAGAPVLDYQGKNAIQFPWIARALEGADGRNLIGEAQLPLIRRAVLDACDALDGLADGVIDDPRLCRFDPGTLACAAGRRKDCLDPAQVAALRKVYDTPRNSRGEAVYPAGTVVGSEGNWLHWLVPTADEPVTYSRRGAEEYLRYLAFEQDPGPDYDYRSFEFDTQLPQLQPLSPVYDALQTDLSAFRARGGRLLLWHGWADAAISPLMTIRYYDALAARMGGIETTQEFARLFLLPGVHHCRDGEGAGMVDFLSALVDWTEHGRAPARVTGRRDDDLDGVPERIRPVFPYPARAVYRGRGDPDDVDSYTAVE